MKQPKSPDIPLVLTATTCPVCGRVFEFSYPVTLRRLAGNPALWHTEDGDGLPDIWVSAPSHASAAAALAKAVCELDDKFNGPRIASHYKPRP